MGGTDQQNFTKKALGLCLTNKNIISIDIVTGSYYADMSELQSIIKSNKQIKIKLHSNLTENEIATDWLTSDGLGVADAIVAVLEAFAAATDAVACAEL